MSLTLPAILDIPDKLLTMIERFNDYRYFLLEGGRGGGKSQAIARFFLYLADRYSLRMVCGRETQKSITESVHSILADLIREHQLNFDIQANKIVHRATNSSINFRGFREQGAFNIQGMEGVDVLWIDEAQAITKQTLDVLIPTIRKDKAKIFFSMNRHVFNDPVYAKFSERKDCLKIHINYYDNQFCTTALQKEAEECRKESESDYKHIWMGLPLDQGDDALFSVSELQAAKSAEYPLREGYGYRIGGYDIARYGDDKCAAVIIQQQGAHHWVITHTQEWEHKDLNYTTGRILEISNAHNADEDIIDEDGMGAGPFDTLSKGRNLDRFHGFRNVSKSYKEDKDFANERTKYAYRIKDMIRNGYLHITDDNLVNEMLTLRYTYDHNQRRILVSKQKQKLEGIKSQNLFDALMMAVSRIDTAQDKRYNRGVERMPCYSSDDNLFTLSGVR